MGFFDDVSRRVKHKAVEWDVQGKAEKVAAELDKVAHDAKDKAAELADDNRGKIRENLDKAGAKIDERTDGKYADKVAKAKDTVAGGVDKLAEQRPGRSDPARRDASGQPRRRRVCVGRGGRWRDGGDLHARAVPSGTHRPARAHRRTPRRHRLAPGPAPAALSRRRCPRRRAGAGTSGRNSDRYDPVPFA